MKKVLAKIGTYKKDGEDKNRYVELGMIGQSQNGEYLILHPHIDLAGIAMTQRVNGMGKEGKVGVMCSIFDNDNSASSPKTTGPTNSNDSSDGDIPF